MFLNVKLRQIRTCSPTIWQQTIVQDQKQSFFYFSKLPEFPEGCTPGNLGTRLESQWYHRPSSCQTPARGIYPLWWRYDLTHLVWKERKSCKTRLMSHAIRLNVKIHDLQRVCKGQWSCRGAAITWKGALVCRSGGREWSWACGTSQGLWPAAQQAHYGCSGLCTGRHPAKSTQVITATFYGVSPWAKYAAYIISFDAHNTLHWLYYSHFTDKETEAQWSEEISQRHAVGSDGTKGCLSKSLVTESQKCHRGVRRYSQGALLPTWGFHTCKHNQKMQVPWAPCSLAWLPHTVGGSWTRASSTPSGGPSVVTKTEPGRCPGLSSALASFSSRWGSCWGRASGNMILHEACLSALWGRNNPWGISSSLEPRPTCFLKGQHSLFLCSSVSGCPTLPWERRKTTVDGSLPVLVVFNPLGRQREYIPEGVRVSPGGGQNRGFQCWCWVLGWVR